MNQADPLASNTEGLNNGNHHTVFAVPGDGETASLRVVADTHALPSTGKARVRVVWLANIPTVRDSPTQRLPTSY